ncbi:stage II sporulation protein P [Alkalihalobacillus sp. 1P02AB]|uniref:stage II sporulation protein P n=1 Tax=Alkalihalobacillus sp. 1P02AB TaxID=3132260 RepID=UPI0039A49DE3
MRHFRTNQKVIRQATIFFTVIMVSIFIILTSIVTLTDFHSKNIHRGIEGVKSTFLLDFMSMENQYFGQALPADYKSPSVGGIAFELATNIELGDFRSLLGREVPGLNSRDVRIIVAGEGTDITNLPYESPAPLEVILEERETVKDWVDEEEEQAETPTVEPDDEPVVLIYHSHSWESFLPHLPGENDFNRATSNDVNIVNVGEHLQKELEKYGIKTIIDTTNMTELLNNLGEGTGYSYHASREIVKDYLNEYENIDYIIDLHRDSARYDITHAEIDGEDYAKLFFVVGEAHPNYEVNEALAKDLNSRLQEWDKNITRGIFGKDKSQGNGIYNQDLSAGAILLEFGGVDNHMNELHRSAEVFAEIFSEYYFEQLEEE